MKYNYINICSKKLEKVKLFNREILVTGSDKY